VLVSETAIQILISESKKTAPAAISSLKSRRQKSKEGGGLESDDSAESPLDCLFYGVIKCIATRQRSPFRTNGRHNKTERFISVYVVRCWEAIRPSEEKHTKKKIGASSQAWSLCKVLIFENTSTFRTKSMRNLVLQLSNDTFVQFGLVSPHDWKNSSTFWDGYHIIYWKSIAYSLYRNSSNSLCSTVLSQTLSSLILPSYLYHSCLHSARGCILCIFHSIPIVAS